MFTKKILFLMLMSISLFAKNSFDFKTKEIETKFKKAKLTKLIDTSIKIDLVNSNAKKNFFNMNFYGNLNKCFLQKEVIDKLKKAQKYLTKKNQKLSLLMMDCARPRSVSWEMYNALKGTPFSRYVANPATGSMHNYGSAVDISIINDQGVQLDMGINPFYKNRFQLIYATSKNKLV